MNKKKFLSLALVLILVATISFGTLAWFNDQDTAKNTFYVARSDDEDVTADDIFSVDVKEYVDADGDGILDSTPADGDKHTFENILPGQEIAKRPVITNTGKYYDQWICVTITFADYEAWKALSANASNGPVELLNLDTNVWSYEDPVIKDGAYEYTCYLKDALKPQKDVTLFTTVNIPTTLDQHHMAEFSDRPLTLTVVAVAIQHELGETVEEAFTAYKTNS